MKLLDRTGYRADAYRRPADGELTGVHHLLVTLPLLADAVRLQEYGQTIGVELANDATLDDVLPHLGALDLIAIAFPSFADGRGFSLARRLRRAGFDGVLRATGPLIADQLAYALACGFDEIELPDASAARQPEHHWTRAAGAYSAVYQRGLARGANILDRRRAALAGGAHG